MKPLDETHGSGEIEPVLSTARLMFTGITHKQLPGIALIGLAYLAGAWLGVTQTITPEGIAILWPPNAILLSAFLLLPRRQWPLVAVVALIAECIADIPAFPLWAAVAFGLINLLETALAATLIRRTVGERFDFDSLRRGGYFLLYAPLLGSALAGVLGATVYTVLGRADTGFLTLWRLWWFGDALGLMLLTPLIVVLWRQFPRALPRVHWPRLIELLVLWGLVLGLGFQIYTSTGQDAFGFHLTPITLLPFGAWAAARFGVRGAAMTVILIAVMVIGFMVRGHHPYTDLAPEHAVWLMQEYLAVVAVLSIGLAILLHEIRKQRDELELRVAERTAELETANRRLQEMATTDHLTGIANRRHFHDQATRTLRRRAGGNKPASLAMLDLDHFKRINDTHGHEAGDRVINQVVRIVRDTIRPSDLLGRFGGEEFLLLLPDTDPDSALEIAERIRRKVRNASYDNRGSPIDMTVSIGVAAWDGEQSLETLIRAADSAMYQAKEAGRDQVRSAPASLDAAAAARPCPTTPG